MPGDGGAWNRYADPPDIQRGAVRRDNGGRRPERQGQGDGKYDRARRWRGVIAARHQAATIRLDLADRVSGVRIMRVRGVHRAGGFVETARHSRLGRLHPAGAKAGIAR